MMKLKIPSNFPVDHFIEKWGNERSDSRQNKVDTLYIILNEFVRKGLSKAWTEGVGLHSDSMCFVCGNQFKNVKRDLLLKQKDFSYLKIGKNYDPLVNSTIYQLNFKYCFQETVEVELKSKLKIKRYKEYLDGKRNYRKTIPKKNLERIHLEKQFENLDLTLDPAIEEFKILYIQLIKEKIIKARNPIRKYLYYSLIGKLILDINRIKNKKIEYSSSETNHRFNSIFTSVKKEIRSYIRINGNKLIELDLVASHCYVLATILTEEFFNSNTNEYSLSVLYPEVKNRIDVYTDAKNKIKNNKNIKDGQAVAAQRVFHHMSNTYFQNCDLQVYRDLDFESDIYCFFGELYNKNSDKSSFNRNKIKKTVRLWMNHTDPIKRAKCKKSIKPLVEHFPSIEKLYESIGFFNKIPSAFSYLLQRCEAHLVLDVIAKKLVQKYSQNRIFTIHDSFLIEDINIDLTEIIEDIKGFAKDYTSITPGLSEKFIDPLESINDIVLEDILNMKIKATKDERRVLDEKERIFDSFTINWVEIGISITNSPMSVENELTNFNKLLSSLYKD